MIKTICSIHWKPLAAIVLSGLILAQLVVPVRALAQWDISGMINHPALNRGIYKLRWINGNETRALILVLWKTNISDQELTTFVDRMVQSGARHVVIPVWGCQSNSVANDVGGCRVFDPQFHIRQAHAIQARGIQTSFLPIIATPRWEWRGTFRPSNLDHWFWNYKQWIRQLAQQAKNLGQKQLVIATEFSRDLYSHTDRWKDVAREVRKVYQGKILITTNWDHIDFGFWSELDAIGFSAYFPIAAKSDPTQDELNAKWIQIRDTLVGVSKKWNRPLHITELGYPSHRGAPQEPWAIPSGGQTTPDWAIQEKCFRAFWNAWEDRKEIVHTGVWASGDPNESTAPIGFEILGKPAGHLLKRFFQFQRL